MTRQRALTMTMQSAWTIPYGQFIVIASGGRRVQPTGGVYVALALPEGAN